MKQVAAGRDAYGREIWAFLNGSRDRFEVIERDDAYISLAPSLAAYFAVPRRWPRRQRQAIRLRSGDTALDVGCGAGRVSLFLQQRGFRVVAIDNSPLAIRTARKRGVTDARLLPIENIGRLPNGRFGTVIMFGNNFGLFGSRTKARRLLRELHRITAPGAVLLAESRDPYDTSDPVHLRYHRSNRRRGRMSGQIRVRVRYLACVGPWFDYLLVSPREMTQILDGTGWKAERFIRDAGSAYVAVIRKIRD